MPDDAGDAAEPDQGHPLDVGAQPDARRDPRLQGRYGEPGHRRAGDQVDVARGQPGRLERVDERAGAELDGVLDEEVVRLAEVAQPGVLRQRQHGVPLLDSGVGVEAAQQLLVELTAVGDHVHERVGDLGLAVAVSGEALPGRSGWA